MVIQEERERTIARDEMLKSQLGHFAGDVSFLEAIRPELLAKYPEQWIAVFGKQVVANDRSLKGIIRQLNELGIPSAQAVLQFLTKEPIALIL